MRRVVCDACGQEEDCVWDEEDEEAPYFRKPNTWIDLTLGNRAQREDFCSYECLMQWVRDHHL